MTNSCQQQMTKSSQCLNLWPRHARQGFMSLLKALFGSAHILSTSPRATGPVDKEGSQLIGWSWHHPGISSPCLPPPTPAIQPCWPLVPRAHLWYLGTAPSCFHCACSPPGPGSTGCLGSKGSPDIYLQVLCLSFPSVIMEMMIRAPDI